jgi:hypothetical protein
MFAFALAVSGFLYPDLKRMMFQYRHYKVLNRIVQDAQVYQNNARIHYLSTNDFTRSLEEARNYDPVELRRKETVAETTTTVPPETHKVS